MISGLVIWIGVGIIAGGLAHLLLGGRAKGLLAALIVGLLGSVVGSFALKAAKLSLGLANPLLNDIATATLGAVLVIVLFRLVR